MRLIVLVGTSHPLQCGTKSDAEALSYTNMLAAICREFDVKAIAEEIEVQGLQHQNVKETLGAALCRELEIRSEYCDAGPADRGILAQGFEQCDVQYTRNGALSAQQVAETHREFYSQQMNRARERFWLEKIRQLNIWPLVFVCGADHFSTFKALLVASGIDVIDGPRDWEMT